MKEFIVIVTCLTPEYHKLLVPELISLGYTVTSASDKGVSLDKQAISIITYVVTHKNKDSASKINTDIVSAIKKVKMYFYSLVVFEYVESSWHIGNIECETDPTRVLQLKALW